MPLMTVPQNALPGVLSTAQEVCSLCQASPDGDAGCPPSAWVNVVVTPVGNVTADAFGQYMHPLFTFAVPKVDAGKRRATELNSAIATLPALTAARTALQVETDPGCYWIGTPASVAMVGGMPGDQYNVSIQFACTKQIRKDCMNVDVMEPPFAFGLTSFFYIAEAGGYVAFPALPQYHTHFEIVQGSARLPFGGTRQIPIDASYGSSGKIPMNLTAGTLLVSTGIYRTTGAF